MKQRVIHRFNRAPFLHGDFNATPIPVREMRRGNRWTENRQSSSRSRQSREGSRRQRLTGASEIYDDLLDEALHQSSPNDYRPLKKRKSQRDTSEVAVIDQSSRNEVKNAEEHDLVVIESSSNEFS